MTRLRAGCRLRRLAAALVVANGVLPALWILLSSAKSRARPAGLPEFLLNSLAVGLFSALGAVVAGALAAYALARLPVPRRGLVLGLLLAAAAVPAVVLLPALVEAVSAAGLRNTRAALVLPDAAFALPVCTLILLGVFEAMPPGLEEAAMLDGCSRLGALWRVVVPLAAPGLLTAFLLAFVSAWDEFLFALSFTTRPAARTLPAGIALHGNLADVPWPEVVAGLAVLFQERVVAGLATGGMRG